MQHKEKAQNDVKKVIDRLRGVVSPSDMALTVSHQTNHIIQEATSLKNLSQMYIGWRAFL